MNPQPSTPFPRLGDSSTALSFMHREVQAKIHELITNPEGNYELESTHSPSETLSLNGIFHSTIWPDLSPDYERLVNELVSYCSNELLKRILRCIVHGRTKTVEPVGNSLNRREQARQKPFTDLKDIFHEMHDLAGAMIVVQSSMDVERVNEFVSESFWAVKKPNHWSPDRPVGQYWDARFGSYESHNHHVTLKGDSEYPAVIFEVQVTTFKDFIYNQYAHPWYYKGRNGPLSDKDEIVLDIMHGASYLIEMGGEYLIIREKENRNSIEVEHDLFQANHFINGIKMLKSSRNSHNSQLKPCNTGTSELGMATTAQIFISFQYDSNMVVDDCNNILRILGQSRQRSGNDDLDEERVLAIQSHYRLRAWLALDQPSMLLLDGRCSQGPKSEASLVSAKIASSLLKLHGIQNGKQISPIIIPLIFFCGQHRDLQRDPNSSATELALSLFLQLVEHGRSFVTHKFLKRILEVVNPKNIGTICSLLRHLITELPRNVYVVIVIDGLRFFAQPLERKEQTEELVSNLVSVFRQKPLATLKLLFTSPSRASSLAGLFQEDEILRLSRDLPTGAPDNDLTWRRPLVLKD